MRFPIRFRYDEADSYEGEITLENSDSATVRFTVPDVDSRKTIHLILQVWDNGEPNLFELSAGNCIRGALNGF